MPEITPLPADYTAWLANLKARIHAAQQRATRAVNRELVLLSKLKTPETRLAYAQMEVVMASRRRSQHRCMGSRLFTLSNPRIQIFSKELKCLIMAKSRNPGIQHEHAHP